MSDPQTWKDLYANAIAARTWRPEASHQHIFGKTLEDYQMFSSLVHGTHLTTAIEISTTGLKTNLISDTSNFTDIPVVFMAAADQGEPRYGHFVFFTNPGILVERDSTGALKYKAYLVEIVEYLTKSAARFLVLPASEVAPSLGGYSYPEYNPREFGGMWYVDDSGRHFALKESGNRRASLPGRNVLHESLPLTVEFMLAWNLPPERLSIDVKLDHYGCRLKRCPDMDMSRLDTIVAAWTTLSLRRMLHPFFVRWCEAMHTAVAAGMPLDSNSDVATLLRDFLDARSWDQARTQFSLLKPQLLLLTSGERTQLIKSVYDGTNNQLVVRDSVLHALRETGRWLPSQDLCDVLCMYHFDINADEVRQAFSRDGDVV